MESTIFDGILAAVKPPIAIIKTAIAGNEATIIIYEALPCSDDVYAVFKNPDNSLYALKNTGAQYRLSIESTINGINKIDYFAIPITNFLVQNREDCLNSFVMSLRESKLGTIPKREERFLNPYIPEPSINALLAPYYA
jgi:hypothetical protein